MSLRHRPMSAGNIEAGIKVVESVPGISRRYGSAIADLRRAWSQLIGQVAMRAPIEGMRRASIEPTHRAMS